MPFCLGGSPHVAISSRPARGAGGPDAGRMVVIKDAGHFLHLEKPGAVNDHILAWIG
jgi:pimeloyl-ACP methyl ester carboxylesterase